MVQGIQSSEGVWHCMKVRNSLAGHCYRAKDFIRIPALLLALQHERST